MAANSDDCSKYTVCVWSCKGSKATTSFIRNVWSALIWVTGLVFKMLHILLVLVAVYAVYNYIVSTDDHRKSVKLTETKEVQEFYKFFVLPTATSTSPVSTITFTTSRATGTVEMASRLSQFHHQEIMLSSTRKFSNTQEPTASTRGDNSKDFILVGYEAQATHKAIKARRGGQTEGERGEGEAEEKMGDRSEEAGEKTGDRNEEAEEDSESMESF